MSILEPIYAQDAARIAFVVEEDELSYGRFCNDIDHMAHWLLDQGLEPGDRVELVLRNVTTSHYWDWVLHLAAIRCGLNHSSRHPSPKKDRLAKISLRAAIIGNIPPVPAPEGSIGKRLPLDLPTLAPLAEQLDAPLSKRSLDGLERKSQRFQMSSGTTGIPKAIGWDFGLLEQRISQAREVSQLGPETVTLPLLGLLTTAGYRYPLATWQAGGTVIQAPRDDETDEIHARVASANLLIASPQRLRVLLQNAVRDWDRRAERKVKLFGGRLPIAMRNDALVRLAENIEVSYGSTETGSIANGPAADIERHDGAVGYALPGVTIELVDAEDKPVPTGSEGIVRLRTPQMITDYVFALQKEGDASALRDGWFYPGDLGVLAEDGLLAITGRQDETVNCAGVKLPALTFEERINALPGVADCCLTNLKFEDRDVLAIAIMPDGKLGPKRVHKAILDARIVNWPFQFIIVREIPRNAMGKIARREFSERMTELVMRDRAKRQHEKA